MDEELIRRNTELIIRICKSMITLMRFKDTDGKIINNNKTNEIMIIKIKNHKGSRIR